MALPFVILLLLIAIAPIAAPHFWEKFYAIISLSLGSSTAVYYLTALHKSAPLIHVAYEYLGFIALVGSLYVVSGGIFIRVKGEATPSTNVLYLLIGAILSNLIGTTGASMLLIRPWIRMNKYRITGFHIVFFIFIVSNVSGLLTPIGDPPLFLGFLKGVPFWWTLQHAWQAWLIAITILLVCFYLLDRRNFLRAPSEIREHAPHQETWKIQGLRNLPLIALILIAVFLPFGWRESLMALAGVLSWILTPKAVHEANHFDFEPLKEVGFLFAGIFTTMLPALEILNAHASSLGLRSEMQFYWWTGTLSGLLDNAPTYLAFLATAFGLNGMHLDHDMPRFIAAHGNLLLAISVSSVFFGALTYIGNSPNLMVKKLADQQHVHTPGFLAYIFTYALPILLPVLAIVSLLFFSPWRVF